MDIPKNYELKYERMANPNSPEFQQSKMFIDYAEELISLGNFIKEIDRKYVNGLQNGTIKSISDVEKLADEIDKFNEEKASHIELF